ncbi:MAG TPA: hypothetical protein VFH30_03565 [Acidimicrobiales bacterium]|nr:hypothetical protein [Acidimicrobiales bacterium]
MATHRPGDDPTLELPVPAPAPPPVDDTVPYPPYPRPAPTPPPPAWEAPRPRGHGCLVALAIVAGLTVLLVLLVAALLARASDSADEERRREAADVELTDCLPTDAGHMASTVRITNHSSKRSNYVVDVVFESVDGSRQLATRSVVVNDLEPGQATQQQAGTLTPSPERFDCRVSQVQRFSDEG